VVWDKQETPRGKDDIIRGFPDELVLQEAVNPKQGKLDGNFSKLTKCFVFESDDTLAFPKSNK